MLQCIQLCILIKVIFEAQEIVRLIFSQSSGIFYISWQLTLKENLNLFDCYFITRVLNTTVFMFNMVILIDIND